MTLSEAVEYLKKISGGTISWNISVEVRHWPPEHTLELEYRGQFHRTSLPEYARPGGIGPPLKRYLNLEEFVNDLTRPYIDSKRQLSDELRKIDGENVKP